jgi:hypothetical protein
MHTTKIAKSKTKYKNVCEGTQHSANETKIKTTTTHIHNIKHPFRLHAQKSRRGPLRQKSGYIIFHSDLSKWRRKANHLAMWVLQECTQHQFSFSLIFPVKHYSAQFSVAKVSLMKPSVNETVGQMSCQYRTLRRRTWHRPLMHKNLKHL